MNHTAQLDAAGSASGLDLCTLAAVLMHSEAIALAAMRQGRIVFANPAFVATFRADDSLAGTFPGPTSCSMSRAANSWPRYSLLLNTPYSTIGPLAGEATDRHSRLSRTWRTSNRGRANGCRPCQGSTGPHRASAQLANFAYSDALTGLANRALFADCLHRAVQARAPPWHGICRPHDGPRWLRGHQ